MNDVRVYREKKLGKGNNVNDFLMLTTSVADPFHFDPDPDPDPT